jgi:hypothetical protein
VAEAVGYDVYWDGGVNTVILNKKTGPADQKAEQPAGSFLVILNNSTKVYHLDAACRAVVRMSEANREEITVSDISEIGEEYTPCGICAG